MYDIKEMQRAQLEIFKEVYDICKKHDIPVFLAYGTAIGAVRHQGFIPWDDDIDIFIFYEDRKRFMEICQKELPSNLFYQSVETDKEYRLAIDRIRNSDTTLIEAEEKDRNINHGVYIDVYSLFRCSDNKVIYTFQRISRLLYRLFLYNEAPKNKSNIIKTISNIALKLTPSFIKQHILKTSTDYVARKGNSKFLSTFYGNDESVKYDEAWFGKAKLTKYEDILAPIPQNYSKILELQYGNYMELPPVEKRVVHHNYIVVDCNKCYKEYINR